MRPRPNGTSPAQSQRSASAYQATTAVRRRAFQRRCRAARLDRDVPGTNERRMTMAKRFRVTARRDAWVNYEAEIEADSAEEAAHEAERTWKAGDADVV